MGTNDTVQLLDYQLNQLFVGDCISFDDCYIWILCQDEQQSPTSCQKDFCTRLTFTVEKPLTEARRLTDCGFW